MLSGVTAEMLKLLFPAAVEEITPHAAEQREAALLVGSRDAPATSRPGSRSGKAVAAVFTARAATDGMRNAVGTRAQWDAFAANATSQGRDPLDEPGLAGAAAHAARSSARSAAGR